jgi:hypothetical protein
VLTVEKSLESFGFSANSTGGHLARSMMLPEMKQLCLSLPIEVSQAEYASSILNYNILAKPTASSRVKSLRHLTELYSLDYRRPLFRALRQLADVDPESLPLMAMVCTFCRDPQLRSSFDLISTLQPGEILPRQRMEAHIEQAFAGRFSDAMKKSLAQNVNTTWTESGHLAGRAKKARAVPQPRPIASVYAMFAGYLAGFRGEILLNSVFSRLVGADASLIISHLGSATARPYVRFRHAGGVTEVDFSPLQDARNLELALGKN